MEKREEKKIEIEIQVEDAVELLYDLRRSWNPAKLRIAKEITTEILYNTKISFEKYSVIRQALIPLLLELEKRLVTAEALEEEIFKP